MAELGGFVPKVKISNQEIANDIMGGVIRFPLYTSQILNLANQTSQGTRPKTVGQMSELFRESGSRNYDEWVKWYKNKMPDAIDKATDKVYDMVQKIKSATPQIDKKMVKAWVEDLVLTKTFLGFRFQESIFKTLSKIKMKPYRLANPKEESKGIDGYVGNVPISIKPTTYKTKNMLREEIDVKMVYYEKTKSGVLIEYDF